MSKGKILVIGSNAKRIEIRGGWGPTGQYLNETVVPILALIDGGYEIVLATPDGTQPHIDAASDSAAHFDGDQAAYRTAKAFFASDPAMTNVRTLRAVIDEGLDEYAGVFVPGGQAPVVDILQDPEAGEILRHFHNERKPTAMLCHGPIAALAAMPAAREYRAALLLGETVTAAELARDWQYRGYEMTIFSNSEEKWVEREILKGDMYFHVVDALANAGGEVITGPVDFEPHVVVDRELITGQNPRSDHLIGQTLVRALDRALAELAA